MPGTRASTSPETPGSVRTVTPASGRTRGSATVYAEPVSATFSPSPPTVPCQLSAVFSTWSRKGPSTPSPTVTLFREVSARTARSARSACQAAVPSPRACAASRSTASSPACPNRASCSDQGRTSSPSPDPPPSSRSGVARITEKAARSSLAARAAASAASVPGRPAARAASARVAQNLASSGRRYADSSAPSTEEAVLRASARTASRVSGSSPASVSMAACQDSIGR